MSDSLTLTKSYGLAHLFWHTLKSPVFMIHRCVIACQFILVLLFKRDHDKIIFIIVFKLVYLLWKYFAFYVAHFKNALRFCISLCVFDRQKNIMAFHLFFFGGGDMLICSNNILNISALG